MQVNENLTKRIEREKALKAIDEGLFPESHKEN